MSVDSPPATGHRQSAGAPGTVGDLCIAGRLVQPQLNRIAGPEPHASIQVEPKVMEVLLCLAAKPHEVVSREALLDRVWQGAFVSDDVLTRSIGQLRRIFGDDVEHPRVIETIRKRGYRLLAAPETASKAAPEAMPATEMETAAGATARLPAAGWSGEPSGRAATAAGVAALAAVAVIVTLAATTPWLARRPASLTGPEPAPAPAVRLLPVAGVPANATRPALSPDGTRVALTWNGGSGNDLGLFVAGLAAGAPAAITSHAAPALDLDPRWSPDGTLIAFARQTHGGCQLLTVPAAGGPERQLVPCVDDYTGTSWSADGRWLAYVARPARDAAMSGPPPVRLRLLDLVSLRSRDLTSPPGGIEGDHAPAFSPDGSRLAFVRTVADGVEDLFQVAVDLAPAPPASGDGAAGPHAGGGAIEATADAGAKGTASESGTSSDACTPGQPVRVTFDDAGIAGVDWLPNGRDLVLSSDRGGIFSLWRVPATGGTPRLLAGSGAKTKHPSTARHANVVVFESWLYDIGIWRTPTNAATAAPPGSIAARAAAVRVGAGAATPAALLAAAPPTAATGQGPPLPAPTPLGAATREWSFQPQYSPDGRRLVFG